MAMTMNGEVQLAAPRATVWAALNDPAVQMLWGVTDETIETWLGAEELDDNTVRGYAASPGVVEGVARVLVIPPPHHGEAGHNQSGFDEILARVAATGVSVQGVETREAATEALSRLSGDEVVLLLSSGPLLGLPDSLPPVFDGLYAP